MWMANPRPGEHLPGMQPGPLANWLQAVIDTGYLWQFIENARKPQALAWG